MAYIFVKLSLHLKKRRFLQKNVPFAYKIFGEGKLSPALLHLRVSGRYLDQDPDVPRNILSEVLFLFLVPSS
jgi:hypothetical protein